MTTMTDTDIVEALARKEGLESISIQVRYNGIQDNEVLCGWKAGICFPVPDYLNDRNSLQPILDGLTEEEWKRLWDELSSSHMPKNGWNWFEFLQCVLTLKPRDLAICLVKALKLGRED